MARRRFMESRASILLKTQKIRVGTPKSSVLAVSAVIYTVNSAIRVMFQNVNALTL